MSSTSGIKSRTIDNLGLDSSVRYAKDVEANDIRLIEDSKIVSRRIEIAVTKPYTPSEFDQLFSAGKSVQWALFTPPPGAEMHTRPLFSYQLIPSLGTAEKQEAGMDKISELEDALNKPRKKRMGNVDEREEKEEQEARKTLLALLKCIDRLDRTLTFINARRNQYHRG